MKELSIEEKAYDGNYKAYTELINRLEYVKDAIKKQNYGIAIDVLCKPYPDFQVTTHSELKESENWIPKEIIKYLKEKGDFRSCWIAWLERQGNLMKALQISNVEIGELIEKNYYLREQLEKQGKNNMGISEATKQKLEDNLNKALEKETPESCNEFLKEQKSVGKAKPKFHEGEWVFIEEVKGYKNGPFQIKTVDSFGYSFDEYHTIPFMYEELLSKWTIQDAKDGDVLFTSSTASHETFIFKNIDEKGNAKCYFAYDSEDGFREGKYHFIGRPTFMTHPATKEQRDLLFQKMKEEGYEWDVDKKELKKIIDEKQIKKNLQDNHFRRMFEQESAEWSEGDEEILYSIINDIEIRSGRITLAELKESYTKQIDWLKSLKERVQPKQEWSEEDSYMLGQAIKCVSNSGKLDVSTEEIEYWLKSIGPQKKWKPSNEQMNAFDAVLVYNPPCSDECRNHLITLYSELKKLMEE